MKRASAFDQKMKNPKIFHLPVLLILQGFIFFLLPLSLFLNLSFSHGARKFVQ
jgi:hypothetical protein